jgi:hypothetical protein
MAAPYQQMASRRPDMSGLSVLMNKVLASRGVTAGQPQSQPMAEQPQMQNPAPVAQQVMTQQQSQPMAQLFSRVPGGGLLAALMGKRFSGG